MTQLSCPNAIKSCLLITAGLFLFPPHKIIAQDAVDNTLIVYARIYPKKSDYIEVLMDPRRLPLGYYIGGETRYEVNFYDGGRKFLGAVTFSYKRDMDRKHVYRLYAAHPFKDAKEVEVKKSYYTLRPIGLSLNAESRFDPCYQAPKTVKNLKAGEALEVNWRLLENSADEKLEIYPYLIRRADGKKTPVGGYRWVSKTDPNDFRVELLPNLQMSEEDMIIPESGYSWSKPDNPDDFSVVLMPGLMKNSDGTFSHAKGYRWFDPDDRSNRCVVLIQR